MSVTLQKGQKISLNKESGGALKRVIMGLGWDAVQKKSFLGFGGGKGEAIDLDASCGLFDAQQNLCDVVYFGQLNSRDGSIHHTGDNRTGDGEGDDEQIIVDLERVPAQVTAIVFTVNNYTGQDFSRVRNAFCRLIDAQNQREIARYDLSAQGGHNAQIMAKLYRHEGEWKMQAIGENAHGRHFNELLPAIKPYL